MHRKTHLRKPLLYNTGVSDDEGKNRGRELEEKIITGKNPNLDSFSGQSRNQEIKLSERFGEHYGALVPTKWMYHEDPVEKLIEGNYWDISPITAQLVPTLNCTHKCYFCTYGGAKGSLKKGDTRAVADTSKLRIKQRSMPF